MKISEFSKEDRSTISEDLEAQAKNLGFDKWDPSDVSEKSWANLKDMLGLCADCQKLDYCRTEYGSIFARCDAYDMRLNGSDRIKECTRYSRRGTMSLDDAIPMAHIIDVNGRKIGF